MYLVIGWIFFLLFLDFDDIPDYEKKRLENIEMKNQFFKAQLQNTISALKAKQEVAKPYKCDKCPAAYTG